MDTLKGLWNQAERLGDLVNASLGSHAEPAIGLALAFMAAIIVIGLMYSSEFRRIFFVSTIVIAALFWGSLWLLSHYGSTSIPQDGAAPASSEPAQEKGAP